MATVENNLSMLCSLNKYGTVFISTKGDELKGMGEYRIPFHRLSMSQSNSPLGKMDLCI